MIEAVAKIAADRGVPRAQIALAWLSKHPAVTAPIVGATKPHHLDDADRVGRHRAHAGRDLTRSSRPTRPNPCRASSDLRFCLSEAVRPRNRSRGVGMQVHFANVWQTIADEVGDRTALIHGDERVSWRRARRAGRSSRAGVRRAGPEAGLEGRALPLQRHRVRHRAVRRVQDAGRAGQRELPVHRQRAAVPARQLRRRGAVLPLEPRRPGGAGAREGGRSCVRSIEVDDGGPHVDGALRWEEVLASHIRRAPRIEGQPEDIYMLYTGGTTGMPKGVMYTHGVFPIGARRLRRRDHGRRRTADERRGAARAGRPARRAAGVARGVPADARHRHVARHDGAAADEGHGRHAHEPLVRSRTSCGRRSSARE